MISSNLTFAAHLSDLGDSAIIGAGLVIATSYLLYSKCYREALALFTAVSLTGITITLLKILFLTCGNNIYGISSPSGHSALTSAFYGTYGILMYRHLKGWQRIWPVLVFVPLILGIALTRSLLRLHTESEIIVGLVVGSGITLSVWYIVLHGHVANRFNTLRLMLWLALVGGLIYGFRLPAEPFIKQIAGVLQEKSNCDEIMRQQMLEEGHVLPQKLGGTALKEKGL